MSGNELPKISAMLIVEVLGRPEEFLVQTLKDIIKKIGEEKDVEVVDSKIAEVNEVKDKKDFFTTFAEIEVKVKTISNLAILMFKYMPSHIDVIEPETLRLSNNQVGDILSELTRRLHGYEEIVRVMQAEKKIMQNQLDKLNPSQKEVNAEKETKKKQK